MKRLLFLGIALASFSANSAGAAHVERPYLQIMAGPNWADFHSKSQRKNSAIDVRQGFMLGAAAGVNLCRGFRIEEEYSYRHARVIFKRHFKERQHNKIVDAKEHVRAHYQTSAVLANLLVDLPLTRCRFTPYFGGGVGYGWNSVRIGKGPRSSSKSTCLENYHRRRNNRGFAWQGIAGIAIPMVCNTDLGLEYRYFRSTSELRSNAFIVTTKFNF